MSSSLVFNPNTYAGQSAGGYLSKALLGARSVQQGLVKAVPNAKKRTVLRLLDQEVVFQDVTADFNALGDTTVSERYLDPLPLSVMYELAFADLLQSWEAAQLSGGSGKEEVPGDLAQYLIAQMQAKVAAGVEKLIWQGKSGSEFTFTAPFSGLIAKLKAASSAIKLDASVGQMAISGITIANPGVVTVASTSALKTGDKVTIKGANAATLVGGEAISGQSFTITVLSGTTFSLNATTTGTATGAAGFVQFVNESNVVEVLAAVYKSVPDAVRALPDFKFYVPVHIADAYRLRQAAESNGAGSFFTGDKALNFLGKPIEEMPYFNANTIMAASAGNLVFGTDLLSDFNEVQVVDMRYTTADQKVRYRAQFSLDVNIAFAEEAVLYCSI